MQHSCDMVSTSHPPDIGHASEYSPPKYQHRALCMSAIGAHLAHKVFDGRAVEAILAHMVHCVVLVWQGIHVRRRRHCLMEGGVKDSNLLGTLETHHLWDSLLPFMPYSSSSVSSSCQRGLRLQEDEYLRAAHEDSTCCNNALKVCGVVQGSQVSGFLDNLHDLVIYKHRF